jgi:serine/threonine protein kinase
MTSEQIQTGTSRTEFLKNLAASGISWSEDAGQAPPDEGDGAALAEALVASGQLTPFQAEALLAGRLDELRIGNYDILGRLGAGGMGTVFKARHRRMKRVVALKVLSRSVMQSENFVARFQREVETIARLSHPNIVMAFDADEAEAGPFLVMEFVDGRDLASEIVKNGSMSIADAIDCTVQAARGLGYAHESGLVHRDIKPGNILKDTTGRIKVTDLGLARLNDAAHAGATSLTQAGGILGTIDYMPPEQAIDSTAIDARADQYSLGLTLFFLLTGRAPFIGASAMAVLLMHRDAPIPALSALRSDVSPELEAVFRRMAAKKADDRYPTMGDVVKALEAIAGKLPTSDAPVRAARPTSHVEPAQMFLSTASHETGSQGATQILPVGGVPASPASPVAGLKVVLAEASRTQAGIIRKFLGQIGIHDVPTTGSGRQAIEMARLGEAQVLISSMHLSDMTGLQLAHSIRTDPDLLGIGFVLATSESDSEQTASLLHFPRMVLMHKPFDLARLTRAIEEAAGK